MISPRRMGAILYQDWCIAKRSLEVYMDTIFFSTIEILLFGFVAFYFFTEADATMAGYFIIGAVLWEVIRVTQYSITVTSLWNVWSRNLSNMFITPLSVADYLLAQLFSAMLKSGLITLALIFLVRTLFDFNLFALGAGTLLLSYINLVLFGSALGLVLLGLIFRYGTRVQALGWAVIYIFQPFTAAYFPVSVLPDVLQWIAWLFPITYVFEGARAAMTTGVVDWSLQLTAVGLNVLYGTAGICAFLYLFSQSKNTGQFVRNES